MSKLSRRNLLSVAGSALAVTAAPKAFAADAGSSPVSDAGTSAPPGIAPNVIAHAEEVAGVRYTAEERQQLAATLTEQLSMVKARRSIPIPNELQPATRFDPRLPGVRMPSGKSAFKAVRRPVPPLPSSDEDVAFAPVWQLSGWLRSRKLSSERLTRIYLDRLRTHAPKLECMATITEELALQQAKAADAELAKGKWRGPLHGIPFGAKDLFDTAGIETAWGAEPYQGRVPKQDAWVIARLHEAGAVLLGKTTLGALAYGDIWSEGKTRNPWFPAEGSSGSSAGSASATAAGLMAFGLGTETLGSIVSPSMRCGTTGLRPTFGRVPRTGAMALCWTLDKIGPICRSVEDAAMVLSVIAGHDPNDSGSIAAPFRYDGVVSLRGLKVGYSPAWFVEKDSEAPDRAALEALKSLGVQLVEVEPPKLSVDTLIPILLAEAAAAFEDMTLTDKDDLLDWQAPEAWPNSFRAARFITAVDLIQADRVRRRAMQEYAEMFAKVDVIAGPSYAGPMLTATNYTGHPSLTLRAGFVEIDKPRGLTDAEGSTTASGPKRRVPYGFTLWGQLYEEGRLCAVGAALETALNVWQERPELTS